jgi:uracil-DNA glycosylase family 4
VTIPYNRLASAVRRCTACAFSGAAIEPLPPEESTTPARLMFIGESPSWAENQVSPFSPSTASGQALERHYLAPLGLQRHDVWITDLLKCRYPAGIYGSKPRHEDDIRRAVDTCVRLWLMHEIELARPQIVVTLSDQQVYQRVRRMFGLNTPARFDEAVGRPHTVEFGAQQAIVFPLIHPDISRPEGDGDSRKLRARQAWASVHRDEHIPTLRRLLDEM